jgi:ATP-dependent Clp protease protease subunit
LKKLLVGILERHTGRDAAKIEADSDRDYFMSGYEAKEYGLVDEVIEPARETPADPKKK